MAIPRPIFMEMPPGSREPFAEKDNEHKEVSINKFKDV